MRGLLALGLCNEQGSGWCRDSCYPTHPAHPSRRSAVGCGLAFGGPRLSVCGLVRPPGQATLGVPESDGRGRPRPPNRNLWRAHPGLPWLAPPPHNPLVRGSSEDRGLPSQPPCLLPRLSNTVRRGRRQPSFCLEAELCPLCPPRPMLCKQNFSLQAGGTFGGL